MRKSKFIFVGVSTAGSSIVKIFPQWSTLLGLDAEIVGCDLPLRSAKKTYRTVLREIREDPLVVGALVTAHKIDLLRACRDLIDDLDERAALCDEASCLAKRNGRLLAFAKDPIASVAALDGFVEPGHWRGGERDALCLGAGGAAVAISVGLAQRGGEDGLPRRFVLVDILPERLESIRRIHQRLENSMCFEYHLSQDASDNDALLAALPAGSLVINATGLGKDKPGSPLSADALFPREGLIWELNYRGRRDFMRGAQAQAPARDLRVADGWDYFLHGWTEAIAEVFQIEIADAAFMQMAELAVAHRWP
ncbi:MAG: shikimate dehydrogenase [Chloroflexi bacterium]|nr:shikimate dehydrogenase [Chloroflexota bacterium]